MLAVIMAIPVAMIVMGKFMTNIGAISTYLMIIFDYYFEEYADVCLSPRCQHYTLVKSFCASWYIVYQKQISLFELDMLGLFCDIYSDDMM
jgi:hypothetical protein